MEKNSINVGVSKKGRLLVKGVTFSAGMERPIERTIEVDGMLIEGKTIKFYGCIIEAKTCN